MSAVKQRPINSPFGAKSTARDVVSGIDLTGKTAVVTGGYSGIGIETVKALQSVGANVIVPVRNEQRANATFASEGLSIKTITLDLGDLSTVISCANEIGDHHGKIDLLINNAGIMACPEQRLGDHWEAQFATNHLGHFVLTKELLPYLKNASGARVVALSSLAHRRSGIRWNDVHFTNGDYDKWEAYGQSKTANSLFALELNRRMEDDGIKAFSVHPGGIMTPLQRHLKNEEMIAMGWIDENGEIAETARNFFKTPEQGAATTVWCAVSPLLDDQGGQYCEDCDIAELVDDSSQSFSGVRGWAVDDVDAERLWSMSNDMIFSANA